MRSGVVSLGCTWHQPIFNNVGDSPYGDCYLRISEVSVLYPYLGKSPGRCTSRVW